MRACGAQWTCLQKVLVQFFHFAERFTIILHLLWHGAMVVFRHHTSEPCSMCGKIGPKCSSSSWLPFILQWWRLSCFEVCGDCWSQTTKYCFHFGRIQVWGWGTSWLSQEEQQLSLSRTHSLLLARLMQWWPFFTINDACCRLGISGYFPTFNYFEWERRR